MGFLETWEPRMRLGGNGGMGSEDVMMERQMRLD